MGSGTRLRHLPGAGLRGGRSDVFDDLTQEFPLNPKPNPKGSKDSYFKAFGPKDPII